MPGPTRANIRGWNPARQQRFLDTLRQCGSVTHAAQAVGLSASSAYRHRARPEAAAFAAAWDAAVSLAFDMLEGSAVERATWGEERPLYSGGRVVGTQRVHDERLTIFLLKMYDRRRAAGPSPPADPDGDEGGTPAAVAFVNFRRISDTSRTLGSSAPTRAAAPSGGGSTTVLRSLAAPRQAATGTRASAHIDQHSDNASTSASMSASVCTGEGVMRSRSVPLGTVG
jgi:hypothetical protein